MGQDLLVFSVYNELFGIGTVSLGSYSACCRGALNLDLDPKKRVRKKAVLNKSCSVKAYCKEFKD